MKAPCTERYARCCERTGANHFLLLYHLQTEHICRRYFIAVYYVWKKSVIVYIVQVSCNVSEINECLIAYQGEEKDDKTGISGSGFFLDR